MTEAITKVAIEAAKAVIIAVRELDIMANSVRPMHTVPRSDNLTVHQPNFNKKTADKYQELRNFEIVIKNIFMKKEYNTQDSTTVPKILNWLGMDVLRFVQTLNSGEQEKCRIST